MVQPLAAELGHMGERGRQRRGVDRSVGDTTAATALAAAPTPIPAAEKRSTCSMASPWLGRTRYGSAPEGMRRSLAESFLRLLHRRASHTPKHPCRASRATAPPCRSRCSQPAGIDGNAGDMAQAPTQHARQTRWQEGPTRHRPQRTALPVGARTPDHPSPTSSIIGTPALDGLKPPRVGDANAGANATFLCAI